MAQKQYYGIKYPFTANNEENYFVDLCSTMKSRVRGQIMHVIFTPKGQRLRNPEFGTDLIKYIFDNNNSDSWEGVKNEIKESVAKYVNNVAIDDVKVIQDESNDHLIYVRIDYKLINGNSSESDSISVEL